jgi:MOSC domain-containing protein YiiM
MKIRHIYISPGHNYKGHHGREPDAHPIQEVESVECVAGTGLVGDRYFNPKRDYKGQITFFSWEVYRQLCDQFGVADRTPMVFRRNVIVEGADLNQLIGRQFELQGLVFEGVEECKPCYWMDRAFGPGAEKAMAGQGGLRARIVKGGVLKRDV